MLSLMILGSLIGACAVGAGIAEVVYKRKVTPLHGNQRGRFVCAETYSDSKEALRLPQS